MTAARQLLPDHEAFTKLLIEQRAMSKLGIPSKGELKRPEGAPALQAARSDTAFLEAFNLQLAYTCALVAACACKTPHWHRMTGDRHMHAPACVDVSAAKL